jgi:hypothetical protein
MSKPLTRYVVGADLHFPKYDKPTFNAMLQFISDTQPDGFIFQGDQFDNEEISHHTKGKPLYRERGAFKRNTERFKEDVLGPLEDALPKKAEKVWIIGNHDDWEFELIEEQPELEWMIDRPSLLDLENKGWEIIPLGHVKEIGELNIIHGEVLTGVGNQAGAYPSRKAVDIYSGNVLAAHTHAPQSFTKISPVLHRKKWMAHIAPILGATNPTYLRNRPTAWLNGFTIIEFWDKGMFNLYPVIVTAGKCSYGGKIYGK